MKQFKRSVSSLLLVVFLLVSVPLHAAPKRDDGSVFGSFERFVTKIVVKVKKAVQPNEDLGFPKP